MSEVIAVSIHNPASSVNYSSNAKEAIKEVIERNLAHIERQRKELLELKASVEAMERRAGYSLEQLPLVRPNEYKGMRAVDALESYLRVRRGFKIPLARAVADLVEGGVDPGQPRGKKTDPVGLVSHTLKISIPNRPTIFSYAPEAVAEKSGARILPKGIKDEDVTVWLSESADQPKRRTRAR